MTIARDPAIGSIALLVLTALVVLANDSGITMPVPHPVQVPHAEGGQGAVAVELAGDSGRNGVYFIPKGTPVSGFLDLAGIRQEGSGLSSPPAVLRIATTVRVLRGEGRIDVRPMDSAKRIALGIPIDINHATREELVLVSGIGQATAERILEQRRLAGAFRRIDDLKRVGGIKEMRLEKLRPYLCIGC